jgi:hypothetical protein
MACRIRESPDGRLEGAVEEGAVQWCVEEVVGPARTRWGVEEREPVEDDGVDAREVLISKEWVPSVTEPVCR